MVRIYIMLRANLIRKQIVTYRFPVFCFTTQKITVVQTLHRSSGTTHTSLELRIFEYLLEQSKRLIRVQLLERLRGTEQHLGQAFFPLILSKSSSAYTRSATKAFVLSLGAQYTTSRDLKNTLSTKGMLQR